MASVSYRCGGCGVYLNLSNTYLYPADFYFEAGNKGSLSFSCIDDTKFRMVQEDKIKPFYETKNYWGIHRKRIKIKCVSCAKLLGHVYDDGPSATNVIGQFGFGPSQVVPRFPRYRFKLKNLTIQRQ